jgi:hypothetical protein
MYTIGADGAESAALSVPPSPAAAIEIEVGEEGGVRAVVTAALPDNPELRDHHSLVEGGLTLSKEELDGFGGAHTRDRQRFCRDGSVVAALELGNGGKSVVAHGSGRKVGAKAVELSYSICITLKMIVDT